MDTKAARLHNQFLIFFGRESSISDEADKYCSQEEIFFSPNFPFRDAPKKLSTQRNPVRHAIVEFYSPYVFSDSAYRPRLLTLATKLYPSGEGLGKGAIWRHTSVR